MDNGLNMICWTAAGALLVPVGVFCGECLAAMLPRRMSSKPASARPRVAVLIPAHNEEACLPDTLDALLPQITEGDTVLVVADNCTDQTAILARNRGVEVTERTDAALRGKGYALRHGLGLLRERNFDVLIVLDADSHLDAGSIDALAKQVARTGRPAQAVYLMRPCENPAPRDHVSTLAFLVKNLVRPLGLHRLGLPVPLTGTGMAIPRAAIDKIQIADGNIVEDMQLGLDLSLAGFAPRLSPDARVVGQLPGNRQAAVGQRRRWEHGHLRTIVRQVPRLALLGLVRFKPSAWAMALDLLVPPLSLLLILLVVATVAAGLAAVFDAISFAIPITLLCAIAAVLACVLLAWSTFARQTLPASSLLSAVSYAAAKIPMYLAFPFRGEKQWIRTERNPVSRKSLDRHPDDVEPVAH